METYQGYRYQVFFTLAFSSGRWPRSSCLQGIVGLWLWGSTKGRKRTSSGAPVHTIERLFFSVSSPALQNVKRCQGFNTTHWSGNSLKVKPPGFSVPDSTVSKSKSLSIMQCSWFVKVMTLAEESQAHWILYFDSSQSS